MPVYFIFQLKTKITKTDNSHYSDMRKTLEKKIAHSIALLRKAEAIALRLDPGRGFWLAFSGGKDSQALYHIAEEAGVKFTAYMSLTSIDPPEVIRFVRRNYPGVEMIPPRMSIYEMARKKGTLPTMRMRWCCAEYKEAGGVGSATLIGIRREESARRAKRGEIELNRSFSGTFDQWEEHRETMVTCVGGKDKLLISPIIDWTERDVWDYLTDRGIRHCSLYDRGYRRIGCILCPMSSLRQKRREMEEYPHVYKKWIDTIQWLMENKWHETKFRTPQDAFDWWISGESFDKWYADKYLQRRLDL